jgi:hypothetical protein
MRKFIYCINCEDVFEIDAEVGFSGKCDRCGFQRHFLILNDLEYKENKELIESDIWSLIKRNPNWNTW